MDRHHYPVEFTEFFRLFIPAAVNFLHLPPVVGMMMGLAYLQFLGYYLRISFKRGVARERVWAENHQNTRLLERLDKAIPFDVFNPMARTEWDTLLFFYGVVLCVGGSMLSVGSAAGVALMGQARGYYTFMSHLRWAPVIALGYIASIATHMWLNANLF